MVNFGLPQELIVETNLKVDALPLTDESQAFNVGLSACHPFRPKVLLHLSIKLIRWSSVNHVLILKKLRLFSQRLPLPSTEDLPRFIGSGLDGFICTCQYY